MPAGDDLAVVLFLWASALAIGPFILDATGWKHPYLIPGLIILAAFFILAGVAWVPFKDGAIPADVMGLLTTVANSRWAWVVLGIVFVVMLWRSLPDISQRIPFLQTVIDPRYMSLREAAMRLYERISRNARTTDRALTDQEVLMTYASIILRYPAVRMFGKRPPSREFRQIPEADYKNLFVGPEATTLQRADCRTSRSSPMLPF